MIDDEPDAVLYRQSGELVKEIGAILAGKPVDVQGAVLVELLAMFIGGHAPPIREEILELHVATVRAIVPTVEQELGDPWRSEH